MNSSKINFSITNTVKSPFPYGEKTYSDIKNFVLGEKFELSLVFIGDKVSKNLNKKYRGKDKPTDILSFPLSKKSGEIFINLKRTKTEAKKFERGFENFVLFLFIHGLLHLKGMDHGSKMENAEKKVRTKFKI
jgi:probable rRNA maturation factor